MCALAVRRPLAVDKYIVYGLIDSRNDQLRYVGQSSRGLARAYEHAREHRNKTHNARKRDWFHALEKSKRGYIILVLDEVATKDLLDEAEMFYISYFRFIGCDLVNVGEGGWGSRGKLNTLHRKRLSTAAKERWKNPAERKRMSRAMRGRFISDDTRKKQSIAQQERFKDPVQLAGLKRARQKVVMPPLNKKARLLLSRLHGGRPFKDQYGTVHQTVRGAAKKLHLDSSTISKVLKGKLNHTGGYRFTYC